MDQDTSAHILLAITGAAVSGLVTAVGFMAWTRANFQRIEEWGRGSHTDLGEKIDKNYESLECKMNEIHKELLGDLSGIGSKVGFNERQASRRYHNLTAAVMLAAPAEKENEVSRLLKEEAS